MICAVMLLLMASGEPSGKTRVDQDLPTREAHLLVIAAIEARSHLTSARFEYSVDWHRPDGAGPYGQGLRDDYECRIGERAALLRRQRNGPILLSPKLPAAMQGRAPDLSDPRIVAQLREIDALVDRPVMDVVLLRGDEATQYIEGESIRILSAAALAQDDQFLDPRWLGLTCDGEDIGLGKSNPSPFPVTEDWIEIDDAESLVRESLLAPTVAGIPSRVRIVERRYGIGGESISDRLWIDTKRGFNVIRREMRGEAGDFCSIVKSTLKRWPDGVWFPARIERGVMLRDGRSRASVIDVKAAEFGCDFAASDLDLTALGAPAKTSVFDTRLNAFVGHWDGSRIVPRREEEALEPIAASAAAPPWGWLSGAALVALTGLFAAQRRRRHSHAAL